MTAFKLTPGLWLVLDVLSVARLTRLVVKDSILDGPRRWIKQRNLPAWYFVTCAWCTSIRIAAGVVALTVFFPKEWQYVAYVLTCSVVAGILTERS